MKATYVKPLSLLVLFFAFSYGCQKADLADEGINIQGPNTDFTEVSSDHNFPSEKSNVIAIKNDDGVVSGYFFSNNPEKIYALEPVMAQNDNSLRSASIIDLAGDIDNFGYGGESNPPCAFYDFSDPVADQGIFDRELRFGDEVESWTHDFTGHPDYCTSFIADEVIIDVREKFSDNNNSKIIIDGTSYNFTVNGESRCGNAIVQSFVFVGTDAAFANDGVVNITFKENGDHIGIDWAKLTVNSNLGCDADGDGIPDSDDACPTSDLTGTVIIDGCDSGVTNHLFADGCTFSDLIAECAANAITHGDFVSCATGLANDWKKDGLITGAEKGAITSCAAQANLP